MMLRHIQNDDGREDVDTPGGYAVNESEKASEHAVNDTGDRMWGYGKKTIRKIKRTADEKRKKYKIKKSRPEGVRDIRTADSIRGYEYDNKCGLKKVTDTDNPGDGVFSSGRHNFSENIENVIKVKNAAVKNAKRAKEAEIKRRVAASSTKAGAKTAEKTVEAVKTTAKAVVKVVKEAVEAIEKIIEEIAEGGWIVIAVVAVILVIVMASFLLLGNDPSDGGTYDESVPVGSSGTYATEFVNIAKSQIGNEGGEIYWRWYGLGSRVEWCAIFVSWVADKCGYVQSGSFPKTAGTTVMYEWFVDRGDYVGSDIISGPETGSVVFFDWEEDGGHDGIVDHVGIVEDVENGKLKTVEGNNDDRVKEVVYQLSDPDIMGFGLITEK